MSSAKVDSRFLYWHQGGLLEARASSYAAPINIHSIEVHPAFEAKGNPVSPLSQINPARTSDVEEVQKTRMASLRQLNLERKGFLEAKVVVSHPAFFHFAHQIENLIKAKDPAYFPDVVKKHLGGDKEDVFYHVSNGGDGKPYDPEDIAERRFVVSGIKVKELEKIQDELVQSGIFPKQLECSTLPLVGLAKKRPEGSGPLLIVEIFEENSLITIVYGEELPQFRSIQVGEMAMCESIRDEMSLKDITSARKLMHSTTFDLSVIGRQVLNPLYRELSAAVGLFEVETGQSVEDLLVANTLPHYPWIPDLLASDLGMNHYEPDRSTLANQLGLDFADSVSWNPKDKRFLSLFAMMGAL